MAIKDRIFPISVMGFVIIFSFIHLGVGIGIIGNNRQYGDFFKPQTGLSGFNIAISIFGLITGILGLVSLMTNSPVIGKVVCGIAGLLAILTLSSLIAALVINAKSPDFVSGQFRDSMMSYANNADARARVDTFQSKYSCCGVDTWIDWANARLVAPSMNGTTTTTTTMSTTTTSTTTMTTTTTVTTTTTTGVPTGKSASRDARAAEDDPTSAGRVPASNLRREKRQVSGTYGGYEGLPRTFNVTFPGSCCNSEGMMVSDKGMAYCVSNANGAVNHFFLEGCANPLDTIAGNQAMGLGVINSFLMVLAVVTIPIMLKAPSE